MIAKPNVLVLTSEGTNCDQETAYAFQLAGGNTQFIHINDLRNKKASLKKFDIIALPGGFSYGDDIVSGKILATELTSFLAEELTKFIERKHTLMIGICNGFQVLIRTGLLPFRKVGEMQATLTNNDSGKFECRWVTLKIEDTNTCVFLKNLEDTVVSYQVAHGEGKFYAPKDVIDDIEKSTLVTLRYVDIDGKPTQNYPGNPNGAMHAIAGITDVSGRILGLMPHPERFVKIEQHPNWRRMKIDKPQGLPIFKNMITFVKKA